MAEAKQISFDLKEAAIALIKHHGIREGTWTVGVEFGLGAGNIGPSPEQAKPAAVVQISNLLLIRHPENGPKLAIKVDAAEVNPKPSVKRSPATKTSRRKSK